MTQVTHDEAYKAARELLGGWPSSIRGVEDYITQQRTREAEQQAEIVRLREGLEGVKNYGLDTLSGRTDGPDDRTWQRHAVNEMAKRASAALNHKGESA